MGDKKVTSFKIERHHSHSWSYEYTIDGKHRDIIADSLQELKKIVLARGFPWEYEVDFNDWLKKDYAEDRISRRAAVERITDESVLVDLAKNASDIVVRLIAINKITDETVLADIVENDSDIFARVEAAKKINNESFLADVAKKSREKYARIEAVKNITDKSVLVDVAKNTYYGDVRYEAAMKISDEFVLGDFDRIIFFDTKTSGLKCYYFKIIELAMLVVEDGKIVEEYDEFINIDEIIHPNITETTGITNDLLVNEGINEEAVAKDLKDRLSSKTLMISHNCQFHLSFIYCLLERHYPHEVDEIVANVKWLDTLTVLKDRKRFPHKFIDAVNHYCIDEINLYRLIDYAKALYKICLVMNAQRDDLVEYTNVFGYNPKYGINGIKFPFIRYKRQDFNYFMVSPNNILPRK